MSVTRKSPSRKGAAPTSKAAARNTQSRPSHPGPAGDDALAKLASDTQTAAAAVEFNINKAAEHGRDNFVPGWLRAREVAWATDLIPHLGESEPSK